MWLTDHKRCFILNGEGNEVLPRITETADIADDFYDHIVVEGVSFFVVTVLHYFRR